MNYTVKELIQNEILFTETLVQIADKARRTVPFHRNHIQKEFDKAETGRDVIVKPAQVGFSSRLISKILHRTITIPNTTSVIVAYEDFITQRLLNKAQSFYDSLPKEFRPEMDRRGTHEKFFADINSVLYIGSARSFTFARGEAIHNFLADEYAFWPDPERIMGPALDRVVKPHEGGRFWVLSTPNGMENAFYDIYMNAKEGVEIGGSPFTPHFYPWYIHEEYRLEEGHPDALPKDQGKLVNLDSDEYTLRSIGIDDEQLRWRRLKKAEKEILRRSGETRVLFEQEYPSNDITCFLTAGDMVYDADMVNSKAKQCKEPLIKDRDVWIWEAPKQNQIYHMPVDPGQGKQTKSVIQVWRYWWEEVDGREIEYGKLCANFSEIAGITETNNQMERMGQMYGNAKSAIEANGHGLGLIHETSYNNLYMRKDIVKNIETMVPGWYTSPRTKPTMIKELMKMLPNLEIPDLRVISELRNIREDPMKKGLYVSVGADDNHDAAAIGVITRDSRPIEHEMIEYGW